MSLRKDPDPFDRRTEVDFKVSVIRVAFHFKVNSSSGDWDTREVQLIHPSLKGFLGSVSLKCLHATEEPPRAERWQEGPCSGLISEGSPPLAQGPIMLSLEKCLFVIDDFKRELLLIFFFCCCLFYVCRAYFLCITCISEDKLGYTNKQRFRKKTTHNPVTQTFHVVNPSRLFPIHTFLKRKKGIILFFIFYNFFFFFFFYWIIIVITPDFLPLTV